MILSNQDYVSKHVRECFIASDNTGFIKKFLDDSNDSLQYILTNLCSVNEYTRANVDTLNSCEIEKPIVLDMKKKLNGIHSTIFSFEKSVKEDNRYDRSNSMNKIQSPSTNGKSKFAEIIKNCPDNKFSEFKKFDGLVEQRKQFNNVVEVNICVLDRKAIKFYVINTALVSDVIGLAFCEFLADPDKFELISDEIDDEKTIDLLNTDSISVHDFAVFICETECGECDNELPALDPNRVIGQFQFPYLAIKKIDKQLKQQEENIIVDSLKDTMTNESFAVATPTYKSDTENVFNVIYLRAFKKPIAARLSVRNKDMIALTYRSKQSSSFIKNKSDHSTLYKSKVINIYTEENKIQLIRLYKDRAMFYIYAKTNKKSHRSTFQFECLLSDFEQIKHLLKY